MLSLQSCPTLYDWTDCSLLSSSVHGISQARILEWVAMPSSRGSSQPRDQTQRSNPRLLQLLYCRRILYCWATFASPLATSCEELTHWKRLWCWEGLGAGGEGVDSGWDGWMASLTRWTWVWVDSGSWWWTGRPGMLQFMGSQRVGHDWATELNCALENSQSLMPFIHCDRI